LEIPVVSSDLVRKRLWGVSPTSRAGAGAYSSSVTAETYTAMIEVGRTEEAPDGGVVIDATFSTSAQRAQLESALRGPIHWIVCEAPEAVLQTRAAARVRDPSRISDAGPDVAVALARGFEPVDGFEHILHLDTRAASEALVQTVAVWLDAPASAASA